jgi:hypothetical protein
MRRPAPIAAAAVVALVAAALLMLSGCSLTSSVADIGNSVPAKDFVGNWTGTDMTIDGTWYGTYGVFSVAAASQGGGIVVAQTSSGLTAQIVGASGAAGSTGPAFPATLHVDTLSFTVPAQSGAGQVWDLQLIEPSSGTGLLQVNGDATQSWNMEQVPQIPVD